MRASRILIVSLLVGTLLVGTGGAQTDYSTPWGATEHQMNNILRVSSASGSLITSAVSPFNNNVMMLAKQDAATDACWLTITANDGDTVIVNKAVPTLTFPTNGGVACYGAWIDEDSLIITTGQTVIRSDNNGQQFTTLAGSVDLAGFTGEVVRDLMVLDADTWLYLGIVTAASIRPFMARTDNAGASWTAFVGSGTAVVEVRHGSLAVNDVAAVIAGGGITAATVQFGATDYRRMASSNGVTSGVASDAFSIDFTSTVQSVSYGASFIGNNYAVMGVFQPSNSQASNDIALIQNTGSAWTYTSIFVMPAGASGVGIPATHAGADSTGYGAVIGATIGGIATYMIGFGAGVEWTWREVETLSGVSFDNSWIGFRDDHAYFAYAKTATGPVFLSEGENFAGDAAAEAEATVEIDDLVGWKVSPSGSQIITREGIVSGFLGRNVRLYNGNTLAAGAAVDSGCHWDTSPYGGHTGIAGATIIDSIDGPNQGSQIASFLNCDAGGGEDVSAIRIKKATNAAFVNPSLPAQCDTSPFESHCQIDILDENLAGNDNVRRDLSDLQTYPFDFSRHTEDGFDRVLLSWGFSTREGDIGVVTLAQINNQEDESQVATANIDPGGGQNLIYLCTATFEGSTQSTDYIYGLAASPQGDVKGFEVFYDESHSDNTFDTRRSFDVTLQTVFPGGQIASPDALSCAQNKLLVSGGSATAGTVRLFTITPTLTVQTLYTGPGATQGFVALDPLGTTAAYTVDDEIRVVYTSNLTEIQTFQRPDLPAGATECGLAISNIGQEQSVYWGACGQDGLIARFAITGSVFDDVIFCSACDKDSDGIPDSQDVDLDGDGVCNGAGAYDSAAEGGPCVAGPDVDKDGDGLCNEGLENQTAGSLGSASGCVAGDTDDDGDGLENQFDSSPGGPGTVGVVPTEAPASGGGLLGLSARNALFATIGVVMVFLFIGYRFTAGNRRKDEQ